MRIRNRPASLVLIFVLICLTNSSRGESFTGIVVKEDGKPVAHADVRLLKRGLTWRTPPMRATSGDDGAFTFDKLSPGDYRVWAFSDELISREHQLQGDIVKVPQAADAEPFKLVMKPGRVLRATVVSEADHKPIAGAVVHLTLTDTDNDFKTDANGVAVLRGLTPESWEVSATAPNRAKVVKSINLSGGVESTIEFALPEGGTIAGRVTDKNGKPVGGVEVNLYPNNSGMPTDYVKSDRDGQYRLDNVPLDVPCRLYFGGPKRSSKFTSATLSHAQREATVDVSLDPPPPGVTVTGTVLTADEQPIAGAVVTARDADSGQAKTDSAGHFKLQTIHEPAARMDEQLIVHAKDLAPVTVNVKVSKDAPSDVIVHMTEPGHSVAGRVVDADGHPVKGVKVSADDYAEMRAFGGQTITDGDGHFALDSLPAKIHLSFRAQGYSEIDRIALKMDADDNLVTLELTGGLFGHMTDSQTGKPVPSFNIRLRAGIQDAGDPYPSLESTRSEQGEDFTSGDGTFHLSDLITKAPYTLVVNAPGYPQQYFDSARPTPGGKDSSFDVKLEKNPPNACTIVGRILDSHEKPVADADVRAIVYVPMTDEQSRMHQFHWGMLLSGQLSYQTEIRTIESTKTDANGQFKFDRLLGAKIDLAYWGKNVPKTRKEHIEQLPPRDRANLVIHVSAPASISGRINRDTLPPLDHLTLYPVGDSSGEIELPLKSGAEAYNFPAVPGGTYTLLLAGEAVRDSGPTFYFPYVDRYDVTIGDGDKQTVDLGFDQNHVLSGTVTILGQPMAAGYVGLYLKEEAHEVRLIAKTDDRGKFRFEHVRPGEYILIPFGPEQPQPFAGKMAKMQQSVEITNDDLEKDFDFKSVAKGKIMN